MSVTRLLILGAVRIFQPAHGYLLRRELTSWHADDWANLNPGSIYNALRSLTRDGLLREQLSEQRPAGPRGEPQPPTGRPRPAARASYSLTPDGEAHLLGLVRTAIWQVHLFEPAWLAAGISFWWVLTRAEALAGLSARRARLEGDLAWCGLQADAMISSPATPDHVAEHFRLSQAMIRGEIAWVDDVSVRLSQGAYAFAGEDRDCGLQVSGPAMMPSATAAVRAAGSVRAAGATRPDNQS